MIDNAPSTAACRKCSSTRVERRNPTIRMCLLPREAWVCRSCGRAWEVR